MVMKGKQKIEVRAPIAGVFYRKPSPDADPYVEVGQKVTAKQVLALLETMKVFIKLKSPVEGEIAEIKASDGQVVSMGEVLFAIVTH